MKRFTLLSLLIFVQNAQDAMSYKYKKDVDQTVDKCVNLCDLVEKKHLCKPDFVWVRLLYFKDPCIIRCYNEIIKKQSVKPLCCLWQSYKAGTIECDKDRFIYELCHLISLIFEQFAIQMLAEVTGESTESLHDLFDKVDAAIPMDELVDILEKCYERLSAIITQLDLHSAEFQKRIPKRWVVFAVTVIFIIKKIYQHYYQQKLPIVKVE